MDPSRLANLKAHAEDVLRAEAEWDRIPWYTKKSIILYRLIYELACEVERLQDASKPR